MNADRLLKLAKHLEREELGHDEFHFGHYTRGERKANGCGSSGCALGECPLVFPRDWKWEGSSPILCTEHGMLQTRVSAQQFFDLTRDEVGGLFYFRHGRPWAEDKLEEDATRYEVAQGIRLFIQWKEDLAAGPAAEVAG